MTPTLGFTNELTSRTDPGSGVDGVILAIPYGRYPHSAGLQILDRPAAEEMQRRFRALGARLARRFRGLPIYIGHPDADPPVLATSAAAGSLDNRAYGWVRDILPGTDAVELRVKWTRQGQDLVDDEQFAYFSPHWGMLPARDIDDPQVRNAFRPAELYSLGLTNTPNIPGLAVSANDLRRAGSGLSPEDQDQDYDHDHDSLILSNSSPTTGHRPLTTSSPMKPLLTQLLRRLGQTVPDDAGDAELTAALETALPLLDRAAEPAANSATAAAEIARLRAEIDAQARTRRDDELEAALNDGRITRATRDQWDRNLQTDFDGNRKLLRSLKPAWNTGSQGSTTTTAAVQALGARRGQLPTASVSPESRRVQAIAEAVAQKTANGTTTYDAAFRAVRKEKPELFEG